MSDSRVTHAVMESVAVPFVVMTLVHGFAQSTETLGALNADDLAGLVDWPEDSRANFLSKVREDAEAVRGWAEGVLASLDEAEDYTNSIEDLAT